MKRLLFSVVVLLGFLFNTGFSNDPEMNTVTQANRDTTTLQVKFQNPRVIISDERTSEAITTYFKERDSSSTKIASFLERAVSVIEKDQERRYESALDYLSQESGLSPETVKLTVEQAIRRNTVLKLIYSIIILSVLTSWWLLTRKLLIDWQQRFVQLGVLITFLVTLYILYCAILRLMTPAEYLFLDEILKLSPG